MKIGNIKDVALRNLAALRLSEFLDKRKHAPLNPEELEHHSTSEFIWKETEEGQMFWSDVDSERITEEYAKIATETMSKIHPNNEIEALLIN